MNTLLFLACAAGFVMMIFGMNGFMIHAREAGNTSDRSSDIGSRHLAVSFGMVFLGLALLTASIALPAMRDAREFAAQNNQATCLADGGTVEAQGVGGSLFSSGRLQYLCRSSDGSLRAIAR